MMNSVTTSEIAAQVKYQIEVELINGSAWQLLTPEGKTAPMIPGEYEFTVEWGKLIFSRWDDEQSQSWRVMDYEITPAEITLRASRGMGRDVLLMTLRDEARWQEKQRLHNLPSDQRRRQFGELLAQLIVRNFNQAGVERLTVSGNRSHSLPAQYARLIVRQPGETILAIGTGQTENPAETDGILTAALIWLADYNESREAKQQAARLWLFVPRAHSQTTLERLTLTDTRHLNARIECFEVNEQAEEISPVHPVTQMELLNGHMRELRWPVDKRIHHPWRERVLSLAPGLIEVRHQAGQNVESYQIHGLEFARVTGITTLPRASFGVTAGAECLTSPAFVSAPTQPLNEETAGQLRLLVNDLCEHRRASAPNSQHPFYRLRTEAWLESLLRRNIRALDDSLDPRFVYSQIPAWRADDRAVPDLLTVNNEGRLVVIEIKASEDMNLPMQGLDYWLRVEQARWRNEFTQRHLFDGVSIAGQTPLLYLVAPRLRFHRTFRTVARCLSQEIEAYQIGINTNWRNGVKVYTKERVNA